MKAVVYNWEGKEVSSAELNDAIFNSKWNSDLVHQVVVAQAANARKPWAHAKGRGEVRGGGIKPWRQKGTGRARHGSIRSPLWIGGGVSHGPKKQRNYSQKINKKMLRGALHSVLSKKFKDGEIKLIESMKFEKLKTKEVAKGLRAVLKSKHIPSVLLVPSLKSKDIIRASKNIPKVKAQTVASLNVSDLLKAKYVFVEKEAAEVIK